MTDSVTVVDVGQSPAEIPLPPVPSVLILNSSGGLGDAAGAPDVVVNQGAPAALSPQIGARLKPGGLFTCPLVNPSNGQQLPLYAVAAGPGAQLTLELLPG